MTLTADGLRVTLGGTPVLEGVTARFAPGTLTGLIGPNGAGKSTLARALLGLVPIAAGRVAIDGEDVARIAPAALARRVAYLPQGQALHWPLSVERLIGLGRLPHLAPLSRIGATDRAAIEAAMAATGTLALRDRIATDLSGGERARVLLARALATGAGALIADEPLAALDPAHRLEMIALLAGLAQQGATIVVVLHELTLAARWCDTVLLLHQGRVAGEGPPAAVLDDATLARVYGVTAWRGADAGGPLLVPVGRAG